MKLNPKTYHFSLFTLMLLFLFVGCHKKTSADFTLNEYEYSAGDQLKIKNNSGSEFWTIADPNGNIFTEKRIQNPNFKLSVFSLDGTYTISLYDNTKELKKAVGITKEFFVNTERKELTIKGVGTFQNSSIYVDKELIGHTNTDGELEIEVPIGNRRFDAVADSGEESFLLFEITDSINYTITF